MMIIKVDFPCGCSVTLHEWTQCPLHEAAPDLLEALKECERAIRSLDERALGMAVVPSGEYEYPLRNELLTNIEQAIAKATVSEEAEGGE